MDDLCRIEDRRADTHDRLPIGAVPGTDVATYTGLDKVKPKGSPRRSGKKMDPESQGTTPGTADLIGWVVAPTAGDRSLSEERGRQLLATALGIDITTLASLAASDIEVALGRLRGLVDQCHRLAAEATLDELTGALRRGPGLRSLQNELDRSERLGGRGVAILFIDADGLKQINDRKGHAAGDEFLRAMAAAVRERIRSYDLLIRYGGDEFVCVLSGADAVDAARTAGEIQARVTSRTGGSISVGIAVAHSGEPAASLLSRADDALYASRAERRP